MPAVRNSTPLKFKPHGLSDTLDGSNVFSGAMKNLQNLIPDPTTTDIWACRPAAISLIRFSGNPWSSGWASGFGPTSVSAFESGQIVIGTRVYGMISSTQFGGGKDIPFCFDTSTGLQVPISGVTAINIPTSPLTSGTWNPPVLALIGTKIIVTHPGFNGGNGFFGVIDISNPAAVAWSSGNLTGAITFSTPPTSVGQFNGRAYYLVNPGTGQPSAVFSDSLAPTNVTNANQALTFGDNLPLTATVGLPLNSQLGGVIQSLVIFKGSNNMFQVTGDPVTSNLATNAMNAATGTLAPNAIVTTPKGVAFLAPDGLRLIDFFARVSDPIGLEGAGISVPFQAAVVPSRMAAAYNNNVLRISLQNGAALGAPNQEFWFDFARQVWSGPHTFPFSLIDAIGNTFVGQPLSALGGLFQSDVVQSATSTFVENGTQMSFTWQTAMLPDTEQMTENATVETTLMLAINTGAIYSVTAVDQNDSTYATALVQGVGTATIWGQFQWGQALWGGLLAALAPQWIQWPFPIVFRRLSIKLQGNSSAAFKAGTLQLRYEQLGYLQQSLIGA